MKRRIALSIKLYLEHKILLQSIHMLLKEKVSAEFWLMQSFIGNMTREICHVRCPDKCHVKYNVVSTDIKYFSFWITLLRIYIQHSPTTTALTDKNTCWSPNMLLLAVLEGGTYTPTGRNFYKNLTELV